MSVVKHEVWEQILASARRERDEIECKLYLDSCPWYMERELQTELSWRLHLIEEAEHMLGYRHWWRRTCESRNTVLRFIARFVGWLSTGSRRVVKRLVVFWWTFVKNVRQASPDR